MTFSPYSILIYSPMGEPSGLLKITKDDWSGEGVQFPRRKIGEAKLRKGFKRPGIYLLSNAENDEAYIGEGDPVGERLDAHCRKRSFWDRALFFTSSGKRLNKAHIQHLESRLVGLAREARNCKLLNGNASKPPALSEEERAFAENFLRHMLCIFPILGCSYFALDSSQGDGDVFTSDPAASRGVKRQSKRFDLTPISGKIFTLRYKDLVARAEIAHGDFVVLAGSQAVATTSEMFEVYAPHLVQLRLQLLDSEVLGKGDGNLVFLTDQPFTSPSTAAGAIKGTSSNADGWMGEDGRSLGDILRMKERG